MVSVRPVRGPGSYQDPTPLEGTLPRSRTMKKPALFTSKASRARAAEDAVARAQGVIHVLHLSQTDLAVADRILEDARSRLLQGDSDGAITDAEAAETLAIALNDRWAGYHRAVSSLGARIERLRKLGLRADPYEPALREAEARVASGIRERGIFLPDYDGGRAIAERADSDAQAFIERAESSATAVFMAELAVEGLRSIPDLPDPWLFQQGAVSSLEAALEVPIRRLASGEYDEATRLAHEIEQRADRQRAEYAETTQGLIATSAVLAELRAKGATTARLASQISIVRNVLNRGVVSPAVVMARRLLEDARTMERAYREASASLQGAAARYSAMVREGLLSASADRALAGARSAMRDGDYGRALAHVEETEAVLARAEGQRESLSKSLRENRVWVEVPDDGEPFLSDVQELIARAEKEFEEGDYSGTSEDLEIARVLLNRRKKSGEPPIPENP